MKKSASKFIAAILFAVFFMAESAFAHPPSKIEAETKGETLTVTVMHDVKNPLKHYIKEIVVKVNGKEAVDKKYTGQVDNDKHLGVFEISGLKSGDKLSITATCNMYGSKTLETTVK